MTEYEKLNLHCYVENCQKKVDIRFSPLFDHF